MGGITIMLLIDTVQDEYLLNRGLEVLGIDKIDVIGILSGINKEDSSITISILIDRNADRKDIFEYDPIAGVYFSSERL